MSACGGDATAPEPEARVASIEVTPRTATLNVGETHQLTATVRDASGRALTGRGVSWSTSDDSVAIVATDGLVAAMGGGQATITALAEGKTDQANITVMHPCVVSDLTLTPTNFVVAMAATVTLTATVTQEHCTDLLIYWSSDDTTVATVSDDGVVTGVWPGETTITARIDNVSYIGWSWVEVRPAYPEGRIIFSYLPMNPAQATGFIGLGNLNVLPEDHGAFLAPLEGAGKPSTIPVYAPADGWIEGLIYDSLSKGRDLSMRIRYSTTIRTNFGHLSDFAPEIWEQSGLLERGFGDYKIYIPVSAGQVVAYTGQQPGFDFYVGDDALELGFISPSRYPYPWIKAGYYYDYFEEPLLSQLRAITIRRDEPRAGKVDYDVPGKIIGNWFLEGTVGWGGEPTQLAIVYDFIDGTKIAIADGSTRSDSVREAHVYWVEGNAPRPETIGVGDGLVKYEIRRRWFRDQYHSHGWSDVLGTFLVEMVEAGKIRVEKVLGKRPHEVTGFSGAARLYER